ncbi:MAG TPA: RNA degradosome polyphosphate kinase, partial [Burkholderiales bacterium]|nr:RNA degradosome polyphosphate kinase [Burkholderiales bacterium]
QLAFNQRLLALAEDEACPVLEGLRIVCTVSANLDRLFEAALGRLKNTAREDSVFVAQPRGAAESFAKIAAAAHELVDAQYRLFNARLLPALEEQGIRFLRRGDLTRQQSEWVRTYFLREIWPVLTPIGLDPAHPFPKVLSKSLNLAVELHGRDAFGRKCTTAIVQAPRVLPRVIRVPSEIAEVEHAFVFLSSVLHAQIDELFPGMDVTGCYQFRVTRNRTAFAHEDRSHGGGRGNEPPHAPFGQAVRLEVARNCSPQVTNLLLGEFGLQHEDLYRVDGPVNLVRLMSVADSVHRPDLKFPGATDRTEMPHPSAADGWSQSL